MKNKIALVAALAAVLTAGSAYAADPILILGDNYDAPRKGSGYALDTGVNSGINPPTTRLTGIAAPGLRYYQYGGAKATTHQTVSNNQFVVFRTGDSAMITFSPGSGAADFSLPLRAVNATPALPSVYELKFKMANPTGPGNQRASFGITSSPGPIGEYDFAIQLTRPAGADFYEVHARIDAGSTSVGSDLDQIITNTPAGTYGTMLDFLIRVTDAGPEPNGTYNSRIQVSMDDGATWVYDTQTAEFLNGVWSFNSTGRYIMWDVAGFGRLNFDDLTVNWISGPEADVTQVWSGGGADTSWSTAANWQSGTTPKSGDKLVFEGTAKQSNFNDLGGLTVPSVSFSNGGFDIQGSELTMTTAFTNTAGNNILSLPTKWATSSAKWWSIAAGSQLTINNPAAIDVVGNHTLLGGGTLRVASSMNIGTQNPAIVVNEGRFLVEGPSGGLTSVSGIRVGSSASATTLAEAVITNGANVYLSHANNGDVRVGDSANGLVNRLIVDNSILTMSGADMGIPWVANSTGQVHQTGGTVTGGDVVFNRNGAGTGHYSLKNGLLAPNEISKNIAGGSSSISFDNGTLQTPYTAKWNFLTGVDVAEIKSGGLVLDISQQSVLPNGSLTNEVVISAPLSGPGGLTKIGTHTARLTGASSYAGPTVVQQGRLALPTVQSHPGSIQVNAGAELAVLLAPEGGTLASGGLSLANGSSLNFDLGTSDAVTAPLIQASSASASGPITVNISAQSGQLGIGTITLLQYSGTFGGGGSFVLANLSGLSGQLVHNSGLLQLVINGVEKFTWEGKNGTSWDFGTGNWLSGLTGTGSIFKNGYLTEFNDSGTTGTVDIQTDVAPSPLVVNNNELPYVFNGGSIVTPLLTKTGTSSLTRVLGSLNDFINEIALNEGSLILETTENKSFANPLTGSGTLVKSGSSELTMATPIPDFDGNIQILSGTYKLGADNPLGSTNGSTTIASGATLDVNDTISPHEPVFVSGDGVGGLGAIIDSTTGGSVMHNLTDVTLLGHTTFGSSGRWDLRMRAGTGIAPGLKGNGYNLTKVGTGSTSIAAQRHNYGTNEFGLPVPVPYWDMNLGDVYINEGTLTFAESLTPGNASKTINIAAGAIMSTFDLGLTNPIVRNMFVNGGQIQSGGGARDTNVWTGTINVTGSLRLQVNSDTRMFINGPIVGDGSVSYFDNVGNGFVALNAVNTFSGDLSVENGTLVGGGSIAGNLVMIAGTNSPGMSADLTTGVGNFTVGGNATLAGTTKMELAPGQTPNSDKLTVNGTPTWGGHLQVVLAPGAALPGPGDTFVLFNKVGSGSFASKSLPALRAGLTWNDKIAVDGTLSVAGTLAAPVITDVHLEGTDVVLSGTGGVDGMNYNIITSTNVAAPINQWTTAATAVFGPGGTFSFTNSAAGEKMFYRVRIPNQ